MTIAFNVSRSIPAKVDAVGIPVGSDGPIPASVGLSRAALKSIGFEGKREQTLVLAPAGRSNAVRILIGVGDVASIDESSMRLIAAALARAAKKNVSLATTLAGISKMNRKTAAQAVVEGITLATHRYGALKNDKDFSAKLSSLTLVATDATSAATKAGAERGKVIADAVCQARDFANMPPAYLTAKMFADKAVEIAQSTGLTVTVYNRDQLKAMGCGGMIGVNKGSVEPPRMVKLDYVPAGSGAKIVLVGKGVMYDSGGISLKPSNDSHAIMKMDMSGAAAVLATMSTLASLKCKTKVTAYLMCTDNMPSGGALKLGDVLTMRNGKTVEIHNTDAEGRLILADGLSLAAESKPDAIVDIATLTGAIIVAIGEKVAGVMGNNQSFIEQVKASATRTDEPVWQLPLIDDYKKGLDSVVADMRNVTSGGGAGSITAALFLREFVADVPWAHLDIAGTMDVRSDEGWRNRGATAFGTRLLIDLVTNFRKPSRK